MIKILLIFILLSSVTFSNFNISQETFCEKYSIKIETDMEGCFDVKVDLDGEIFSDGWKSSFFYAENALCDGEGIVKFAGNIENPTLIKIRQDGKIYEEEINIEKRCEQNYSNDHEFLIFASAAALLLYYGIRSRS